MQFGSEVLMGRMLLTVFAVLFGGTCTPELLSEKKKKDKKKIVHKISLIIVECENSAANAWQVREAKPDFTWNEGHKNFKVGLKQFQDPEM